MFLFLYSFKSSSSESEVIVFGANEKLVEQYAAQYVIDNIYSSLGLKMSVIPLPPARAKNLNLNKSIDGEIARIKPYGNNKPSLTRIEPSYYYLESAAYCLKDSTLKITSAKDLNGLKVATIRGVAHSNEATANLKYVHKVSSAMQLFEFLKRGRAEVVIDTEINGRRILQLDKYFPFVKNCGVFARYGLYNYINDNKQEVSNRVSSKIKELQISGELEKLVKDAEIKALLLRPEYF
jgi:polar amino acid transport system substrate-binding protein